MKNNDLIEQSTAANQEHSLDEKNPLINPLFYLIISAIALCGYAYHTYLKRRSITQMRQKQKQERMLREIKNAEYHNNSVLSEIAVTQQAIQNLNGFYINANLMITASQNELQHLTRGYDLVELKSHKDTQKPLADLILIHQQLPPMSLLEEYKTRINDTLRFNLEKITQLTLLGIHLNLPEFRKHNLWLQQQKTEVSRLVDSLTKLTKIYGTNIELPMQNFRAALILFAIEKQKKGNEMRKNQINQREHRNEIEKKYRQLQREQRKEEQEREKRRASFQQQKQETKTIPETTEIVSSSSSSSTTNSPMSSSTNSGISTPTNSGTSTPTNQTSTGPSLSAVLPMTFFAIHPVNNELISNILSRYSSINLRNEAQCIESKYALLFALLHLFEMTNQFSSSLYARAIRKTLFNCHLDLDIQALQQLAVDVAVFSDDPVTICEQKLETVVLKLCENDTPVLREQLALTLASLRSTPFFSNYVELELIKDSKSLIASDMIQIQYALSYDLSKLISKTEINLYHFPDKTLAIKGVLACIGECHQRLMAQKPTDPAVSLLREKIATTQNIEHYFITALKVRDMLGRTTTPELENLYLYSGALKKSLVAAKLLESILSEIWYEKDLEPALTHVF